MKVSALTGDDNYFEDFSVGQTWRHARGKTVTEMDGVLLTHLVMNTAQAHFNEDMASKTPFEHIIVFGGVVASIVIGLASQDTAENALRELGLDGVRFKVPTRHGDTLYATTEVVAVEDGDRDDAGIVTFKHTGMNHEGEEVCEATRTVLVKRRSHWADR